MLELLLAAGMRFTTAILPRGFHALTVAFEAGFDFAALVRLGVRPQKRKKPYVKLLRINKALPGGDVSGLCRFSFGLDRSPRDWPCWRLFSQVMLFGLRLSELFYCLRMALNKARTPSNAKNAAITPASDRGRSGQRSCNTFEACRCCLCVGSSFMADLSSWRPVALRVRAAAADKE
jgi:hypothetical protein